MKLHQLSKTTTSLPPISLETAQLLVIWSITTSGNEMVSKYIRLRHSGFFICIQPSNKHGIKINMIVNLHPF